MSNLESTILGKRKQKGSICIGVLTVPAAPATALKAQLLQPARARFPAMFVEALKFLVSEDEVESGVVRIKTEKAHGRDWNYKSYFTKRHICLPPLWTDSLAELCCL